MRLCGNFTQLALKYINKMNPQPRFLSMLVMIAVQPFTPNNNLLPIDIVFMDGYQTNER